MDNQKLFTTRKPKPIRALINHQRGAISIFTAIFLPLMLGVMLLTIDVTYALSEKSRLQSVADHAARAAAQMKVVTNGSISAAQIEAVRVAAANKVFDFGTYGLLSGNATVIAKNPEAPSHYQGVTNAIQVKITKSIPNFFGPISFVLASEIGATAVASWDYGPCLMALGPYSPGNKHGIDIGGSVQLTAECGVYSNSNSSTSINASGSGGFRYQNLIMAGTGNGNLIPIDATAVKSENQAPVGNPFANILSNIPTSQPTGVAVRAVKDNITGSGPPIKSACNDTPTYVGGVAVTQGYDAVNKKLYLAPGYYSKGMYLSSPCPGSTVVSSVELLQGIYYLDDTAVSGKQGYYQNGLDVRGDGVTLALMGAGAFDSNGGATYLRPRPGSASDPFPGVIIIGNGGGGSYQGFTSNTSSPNISGKVVLPNANVMYTGSANFTKQCLMLIANSLNIQAGGSIGGDCPTTMVTVSTDSGPLLKE